MATRKERLDKVLVDRGLCASRTQAQALIMAGKVKVGGLAATKPGMLIAADEAAIDVAEQQPYVSRGGLKLEKAIRAFSLEISGKPCMDVGASTGGFTDCLLQQGAKGVIAVDVGYGQLDWKLRNDVRVTVLEKTNIRELQADQLPYTPSLGVVDTSFISLKKVLPPLSDLLEARAEIMALLKPQFEHKDYVSDAGFKGVVRGEENHRRIIAGVLSDLSMLLPEWRLDGLDFSPITGPKGNIEFLLYYTRGVEQPSISSVSHLDAVISEIIKKSYAENPLK